MGRFHVLCGQGAVVSLRKTWKMQEVSVGGGDRDTLLCSSWQINGVCFAIIQVLYSLQRPVLRLGGRRRLQEGGRKHQVSHLSPFHRRRSVLGGGGFRLAARHCHELFSRLKVDATFLFCRDSMK